MEGTSNNYNLEPSMTGPSREGKQYIGQDEIIVHSMPKIFLGAGQPSAEKAKATGFLILGLGLIILIFIFAAAYYYFIKDDNDGENEIKNYQITRIKDQAGENGGSTSGFVEEKEPLDLAGENEEETEESLPEETEEVFFEDDEDQIPSAATTSEEEPEIEIIDINIPATTTAATTSAEEEQKTYESANDTDKDGLSDLEEDLLGTDIQNSDSDGDGYQDRAELKNLYNPAGPGTIIVNGNIKKYSNLSYGYFLYYPSGWKIETIGGDDSVMFKIGNDQFIQIIIQDNIEGQELEEWYLEQFDADSILSGQRTYKKGWYSLKSPDGLNYYLAPSEKDRIYTIAYNIGLEEKLNFYNIFIMMIDSLEI